MLYPFSVYCRRARTPAQIAADERADRCAILLGAALGIFVLELIALAVLVSFFRL